MFFVFSIDKLIILSIIYVNTAKISDKREVQLYGKFLDPDSSSTHNFETGIMNKKI
jgi:hypothetical protein